MKRNGSVRILLLCVLAAHACTPSPRGAPATPQTSGVLATEPADVNRQLDQLAEAYFDAGLALNPVSATAAGDNRYNNLYSVPFAADTRSRLQAMGDEYFARLQQINRNALDAEHRITYDVFLTGLEDLRGSLRVPAHLVPLNQFRNFTASFMQLGSGTGLHPFRTVKDYEDFLGRIQGFQQATDAAIANMREGMRVGIVQPRVLMERVLPQLAAHIVDDPAKSLLWGPVANMPATFTAEDRARLTAAYRVAIRDRVVPSFRKLHDFVRDEYMPVTRATAGLSAVPGGRAWYEYAVRSNTTTGLTPRQVHDIGLAEVVRIHREMESVMRRVGWSGDLQSFMRHVQSDTKLGYASREEMLADFRNAQARIDSSTDRLFDVKPRANYEIRPVEEFREQSASAGSYVSASVDGTRPGIFFLNTYDPSARRRSDREALLIHEGSPGHHFQISIARELDHLPRMRRFNSYISFSEGWGLYAETLGAELGFYTDPYQYYGFLSAQLWRAIRLVIDTGIHAQGWSLEQAMEYARRNSSESETNIRSEVERFAAIPGQALAYKIGQLRITELRRRAEAALGPRFDIKAFHRAVLENGSLPLDVLEARITVWIAEQQTR